MGPASFLATLVLERSRKFSRVEPGSLAVDDMARLPERPTGERNGYKQKYFHKQITVMDISVDVGFKLSFATTKHFPLNIFRTKAMLSAT